MSRYLLTPIALTLTSLDNNTTLSLALGTTSIVNVVVPSGGLTLLGMLAIGGNVDGCVVVFSNVGTVAANLAFANESGSAAAGNRFRTPYSYSLTQYNAVWFRYSTAALRWQQIGAIS